MRIALGLLVWLVLGYFVATAFGRVCRWADGEGPPARAPGWRLAGFLGVALLCGLFLTGCGSSAPGSATADPPASTSNPPPASSGNGSSTPPPSAPLPDCPTDPGANTPLSTCQNCPAVDISGAFCVVPLPAPPPNPPPTLPTCPAGTSPAPLACTCPPAYFVVSNGSCIVPAPPVPPPAYPPPTMSLSANPATVQPGGSSVLTWSSTGATACYGASGWPTSDALTPSGFVSTPALAATASYVLTCAGPGGNAEAAVTVTVSSPPPPPPNPPTCTPPDVLIGQTCQAPPTVSVTLSIAPPIVSDDSAGCPDPSGAPCLATVTAAPSSTLAGDSILCYVPPETFSSGQLPTVPFEMGPYPASQDGAVVETIACTDVYNQTASASITLTVVPPASAPPDTFTGSLNGNVETVTWDTHGTDGCYVEQFNVNGVEATLQPGGGLSGTASSAFLSPSYDPYTFTLYCGGAPDPGLPSITVNP